MKRKLILLFTAFALTACGCKASYMPEINTVHKDDKKLNCQQIIYAINEAEFWIKNVNERCFQPHVFAKFLPCTPMVKLNAMRNEYTLSDRVDYLRSLYRLKGCESAITLKGSSIERQSGRIGLEKNDMIATKKLIDAQNPTVSEVITSSNTIITDIPTNFK